MKQIPESRTNTYTAEMAYKTNAKLPDVQFPADVAAALIEVYFLSGDILSYGKLVSETTNELMHLIPVIENWLSESETQ